MSWKDRLVAINLLLLTVIGGSNIHYRNDVTDNIGETVVEARETEPTNTPTEVQPVSEPEPTVAPELSQKQEIIQYIVEVFGDDAPEALMIVRCESRFQPERIGDKGIMLYDATHDEMVGDSVGLFQIRTGGEGWNRARANNMTADEFRTHLKNYKNNVDYAKTIYDRGEWSAWTCKKVL
jgi:hypothetical protein